MIKFAKNFLVFLTLLITSCSDAGDLLNIALDPPKRKPIDRSLVAVNNFFVDSVFGTKNQQYNDITNNLGIKRIRVLFAWTDDVQPTPGSAPNYSFYDDIVSNAPADAELLVVVTHAPSWMTNSANWIDGSARKTWIESWFKPTVARYKDTAVIKAFEIFNEPDLITLPGDAALELTTPSNYFEILQNGYTSGKRIAPNKQFIMAATTSIQRDFPNVLRYNKELKNLGAESFTDFWNVHYYATSYESVVTSSGVGDFLNGLSKQVWVTESGEKGPNNQLAYVETTWPFLKEEIPSIQRFYYYQYGETGPLQTNFGLRTTDPSFPVSDFYIFLRDGTR